MDDKLHQSRRGESLTGYFQGVPIRYEVVDGLAIVEGDIVVGPVESISQTANKVEGLPVPTVDRLWTQGLVPYDLSGLRLQTREIAESAMQHWEERTPIRFTERRGDHRDFVAFIEGVGCYSSVGRMGGRQELSLGEGCPLGAAIHEIGHLVGLHHEHKRADRDSWIRVITRNIQPNHQHNFDVNDNNPAGFYDYESIMHYGPLAFAIDRLKPTLEPEIIGVQIGQRVGLSLGDMLSVAKMYSHFFGAFTRYRIKNARTGGVLDVRGESTSSGSYVICYDATGRQNQSWWVDFPGGLEQADATFVLRAPNSGLHLDVQGESADGYVIVYDPTGKTNQQWYFERVEKAEPRYRIRTRMNNTHALSLSLFLPDGLWYAKMAPVDDDDSSQFWTIEPIAALAESDEGLSPEQSSRGSDGA